jgi:hypothetical protein
MAPLRCCGLQPAFFVGGKTLIVSERTGTLTLTVTWSEPSGPVSASDPVVLRANAARTVLAGKRSGLSSGYRFCRSIRK